VATIENLSLFPVINFFVNTTFFLLLFSIDLNFQFQFPVLHFSEALRCAFYSRVVLYVHITMLLGASIGEHMVVDPLT
jgi:hypothetical protein